MSGDAERPYIYQFGYIEDEGVIWQPVPGGVVAKPPPAAVLPDLIDITGHLRSITIRRGEIPTEQITVKFPPLDHRLHTYAGAYTSASTDLRDAFRWLAKRGRPRRGYRSRAHHAHTGPTAGRLPRRSARTAGPRRRRHL